MTHAATPPRFGTQPLDDQDDLFASPRSGSGPALTARIVCAVCEKPAQIPVLASGKLCDHCRRDLSATAAHVAETLRLAQARRNDAGETYEAEWAYADDTARDQLDRILAQRDSADFADRLARAHRLPDWSAALALWDLRDAFDQAALDCDRIEGWAAIAREALRHATL